MTSKVSNIDYYLNSMRVNGQPLTEDAKKRYRKEIKSGYADLILPKKRRR